MSRVERYDDKFLWHRAVCDECGWKSPTAHADPAKAQEDAAAHVCPASGKRQT